MLDREVQALGPEAIMRMVQEAGSPFSPSSALPFGGDANPPFAESKVPQIVEDVLRVVGPILLPEAAASAVFIFKCGVLLYPQ
jgi:hypothetical protein